jgi:hypothetical protein
MRRSQMSRERHSLRTTAPGVPRVPKPPGTSGQAESSNSSRTHSARGRVSVRFHVTASRREVGTTSRAGAAAFRTAASESLPARLCRCASCRQGAVDRHLGLQCLWSTDERVLPKQVNRLLYVHANAEHGGCLTSLKSSGLHTTGFATGRYTGKFVQGEFSREGRGLFGRTARNDVIKLLC